jgi:hypothetical protein
MVGTDILGGVAGLADGERLRYPRFRNHRFDDRRTRYPRRSWQLLQWDNGREIFPRT